MQHVKIDLKQRRWLLIIPQLLVAAIIALALLASHYQTSQAASFSAQINTQECQNPGVQVDTYPITANGSQIGEVDLYYNSSTGYNCAWTRTIGDAYGHAQHITIGIGACSPSNRQSDQCTGATQHDDDLGDYHYYAGPAAVKAPGVCISLIGFIMWKGQSYAATTNGVAVHCGK
jgi:hypothetical protein